MIKTLRLWRNGVCTVCGNQESGNPWTTLLGKYKNDPTWEGFDGFLKEYKAEMDQVYNASLELR